MTETTDIALHHEHRKIAGVDLHAVVAGVGPAVVLLHGWPFTWRAWRPLIAPLAAKGYTVIAPDLHGTGESGQVSPARTKSEVARDLDDLVAALGHNSVRLVGMDLGTMVAWAWASQHGGRVERLVLAESILPGFGLEEHMNPADGGYWHFGFHMQAQLAAWLTEGKEAAYLAPMLAGLPSGGLDDADRADILAHYTAPGGMLGGFQHYATLLQDGADNRARGALDPAVPVLVLNGEHGLPQQPLLRGVLGGVTDVRADIVPGAGHIFGADRPDWTAARLHRFFRDGA